MIQKILEKIGLSQNAQSIYLRLLESGESSARNISQTTALPRATVYDNLKILVNLGLVIEKNEEYKKIYVTDDPQNLQKILRLRIEELKQDEKEIKQYLPKFTRNTVNFEPKIKFFSGADGIRQVLRDLLWYENIETFTMWPISDMVDILGNEYLENLNRRRIRQNISIRGIWPQDKAVKLKEYPYLGVGAGHLRQLRFAPDGMSWDMSYWLFEDKVAFISSKNECFGFVVHSHDFANMIKAQFEIIWKLGKPIKPEPQNTDGFLKTV